MPKWSLGEMISDLTNRLGRADIPQSTLSRYTNQAYLDVVDMSDPVAQERIALSSTTSGENRIDLPTDFQIPISLSFLTNIGNSARTLGVIAPESIDATGFTPVGIPTRYALFADWLELYPSPNSAYSLQFRYKSFATVMTELSDAPSISTNWRFPIVLKAQSYLHGWLNEPDRSLSANDTFLRHVSALDTDRANRQTDLRVRVVYEERPRRGRSKDFDRC